MALSIQFKTGRSLDVHIPLGESTRVMITGNVNADAISNIIADGDEGAACIRAYQRMMGAPQTTSAIGYQVCYSGDIAISVLLNLIYNP